LEAEANVRQEDPFERPRDAADAVAVDGRTGDAWCDYLTSGSTSRQAWHGVTVVRWGLVIACRIVVVAAKVDRLVVEEGAVVNTEGASQCCGAGARDCSR
jgi:hypothetical protein